MENGKLRIVVVDDSAFMRKSLGIMLSSDPQIEVVGTARNGADAIELVKSLRPDLLTLDIEMPVMDGLTALKIIMAECPLPVIMVSSLTTEGANATLKALELGAVDFIPKEMSFVSVNITKIKDELISKVKTIARHKLLNKRLQRLRDPISNPQPGFGTNGVIPPTQTFKAIALGISTGGPLSLQKVIPYISPKINVPMFIVQHMPPKFTKSLAERLNSLSPLTVKEAENDEVVQPSTAYIAPGGYHMTVRHNVSGPRIVISEEPSDTLHRPGVDVMMKSVLKQYGKNMLGIIMTGMGKDGFEGIKELKALGGFAIAQDEETCVVYGMPKAIVDGGLADQIVPLEKIPETINRLVVK